MRQRKKVPHSGEGGAQHAVHSQNLYEEMNNGFKCAVVFITAVNQSFSIPMVFSIFSPICLSQEPCAVSQESLLWVALIIFFFSPSLFSPLLCTLILH